MKTIAPNMRICQSQAIISASVDVTLLVDTSIQSTMPLPTSDEWYRMRPVTPKLAKRAFLERMILSKEELLDEEIPIEPAGTLEIIAKTMLGSLQPTTFEAYE